MKIICSIVCCLMFARALYAAPLSYDKAILVASGFVFDQKTGEEISNIYTQQIISLEHLAEAPMDSKSDYELTVKIDNEENDEITVNLIVYKHQLLLYPDSSDERRYDAYTFKIFLDCYFLEDSCSGGSNVDVFDQFSIPSLLHYPGTIKLKDGTAITLTAFVHPLFD